MENLENENTNNPDRLKPDFSRFGYWLKKVMSLMALLMPLAYIGIGLFVLLSERSKEYLIPTQRYALSGLMFVYGIFRAYRLIKTQNVKDEDE